MLRGNRSGRGSACRPGRVPEPLGEVGHAAKQAPTNTRDALAVRAHGADQAGAHSGAFDDSECLRELGTPTARQKRDPTRHWPHDGGIKGQWPQALSRF